MPRKLRSAALLVALLIGVRHVAPAAHEIPSDVTIQIFIKPDGRTLRVLVRVPLAAMRDLDYPRRGQGSGDLLDLTRAEPTLRDAATMWVADDIEMYEDDARLGRPRVAAVQASVPSDRSFASYEDGLAHVTGPRLPDGTEFRWSQGLLDVLFEYSIQSDRSRFSIRPRLARLGLRTQTVLRFVPAGGTVRAFELVGDPGLVRLDPSWHQAAWQFAALGFQHILDGTDHLLFLLCLVIPFRRVRGLVAVVTSFTVAHSITLLGSAYGLAPDALWFPPFVEWVIAASILYMALENIVAPQLQRRWLIAFGFGLVHGFGFSFGLRQTLQFAGSHLLASLLSFNIGVEAGQLAVLVVLVPALHLLFRRVVAERMGTIVLSALVAHTAWHWTSDRYTTLRQYRFEWPALDINLMIMAIRWTMVLVVAAGLYWLVSGWLQAPKTETGEQRDVVAG